MGLQLEWNNNSHLTPCPSRDCAKEGASTDISENNLEDTFGKSNHVNHYHLKRVNHRMVKINEQRLPWVMGRGLWHALFILGTGEEFISEKSCRLKCQLNHLESSSGVRTLPCLLTLKKVNCPYFSGRDCRSQDTHSSNHSKHNSLLLAKSDTIE